MIAKVSTTFEFKVYSKTIINLQYVEGGDNFARKSSTILLSGTALSLSEHRLIRPHSGFLKLASRPKAIQLIATCYIKVYFFK